MGYRGGEMVLDAIASLLLDQGHSITRIYTMFDNGAKLSPTLDALPRTTSRLNHYPPALRRWLLLRYPSAVRWLSSQLANDHAHEPIDLLISTSSSAIKAIAPPLGIPHICYCHSPARYLWSQTTNYKSSDLKGRLRSLGLNRFAPSLRRWDKDTAPNVTTFIANSSHTAAEINRCYQRESLVIHPPVRTVFFTPGPSIQRTDELLLVSALEPYKRVDLAIDAAIIANRPLTIVGSGSHESALRKHAARRSSITFAGPVTDETLRKHYQSAAAFLFPQIEDFGITAVEAQACGCPVIAYRAGGALDSVVDQQTGRFFSEPTAESLADAIKSCPSAADTQDACARNAQRFSLESFQLSFTKLINDTVN